MTPVKQIETPVRDILGEGPMWSARQSALFWVDIFGEALNRLDIESGEVTRWAIGERIGWIVERRGEPGYLVGLKSGFASLSLEPFELRRIGNPEPERPQNRLNDAKVDKAGRLWAGSKDDSDQEASGALYRLDPDLTWHRCDDGYLVTNGPAFGSDGRTCYHCDSGRRLVYAFDVSEDGELSNRRVFIRFENDWGYPDGLTMDARGGLWVAHWDGSRISRFTSSGTLDRSIALPTARVTSMTFGGSDLSRLFVTTASFGLDGDSKAGSLFEVFTGECGLPATPFGG